MSLLHIAQQIVDLENELDFMDEFVHAELAEIKRGQLDDLRAQLLRIYASDLARIITGHLPIYFKNLPIPHPDFTRKP